MPETLAHLQLKRLAVATLLRWGCQAAANEVLCPISRFRVDAAGWLDAEPVAGGFNHLAAWAGRWMGDVGVEAASAGDGEGTHSDREKKSARRADVTGGARVRCEPRTVIVECKQSRADFLRDRDNLEALLKARDELEERRRRFAGRVQEAEPHLQSTRGVLFSELGDWDLASSSNPTYRRILRELEKVDERLHGGTKFHRLARYRLADRLYLLAPAGVVKRREVPPGWGLLECSKRWGVYRKASLAELSLVEVRISVEAPRHASPLRRRERLLRNIAVALTRGAVVESARTAAGVGERVIIRAPRASSGPRDDLAKAPGLFESAHETDRGPELALGVRMEGTGGPEAAAVP
ncbi:MAG: hypothetical protein ACKVZJ_12040 [Phycisphaerales bacterium]